MNPDQSLELDSSDVLPARAAASEVSPRVRAESRQKTGRAMILAGFVISIVGVVLYCVASFAGGIDADMGDILLRNTVPFARATLGVLGIGTLVWLVGSFTYLRGAMDAEELDPEPKRPDEH